MSSSNDNSDHGKKQTTAAAAKKKKKLKRPRSLNSRLSLSAHRSGGLGLGLTRPGSGRSSSGRRKSDPPCSLLAPLATSSSSSSARRQRSRGSGQERSSSSGSTGGAAPPSSSSAAAAAAAADTNAADANAADANAADASDSHAEAEGAPSSGNAPAGNDDDGGRTTSHRAGGGGQRKKKRAPHPAPATADSDQIRPQHPPQRPQSPQSKLESLTLRLSTLEERRSTKRRTLQSLFEEMQSIRGRMTAMEGELQGLDDEIEGLEGETRRLARMVENGGDGDGDGEGDDGGTQCLEYASTQLSPTQCTQQRGDPDEEDALVESDDDRRLHQQQPQGDEEDRKPAARRGPGTTTTAAATAPRHGGSMNIRSSQAGSRTAGGFVGHTQDVGTQDLHEDDEGTAHCDGEEEKKQDDGQRRCLTPPPPTARDEILTDPRPLTSPTGGFTMNPDEVLTEPPEARSPGDDDDGGHDPTEDDIDDHYDEAPPPPNEDDEDEPDFDEAFGGGCGPKSGKRRRMSSPPGEFETMGVPSDVEAEAQAQAAALATFSSSTGGAATSFANNQQSRRAGGGGRRPSSGGSTGSVLEVGLVYRASPPEGMMPTAAPAGSTASLAANHPSAAGAGVGGGGGGAGAGSSSRRGGGGGVGGGGGGRNATLERYFVRTGQQDGRLGEYGEADRGGILAYATSSSSAAAAAAAAPSSSGMASATAAASSARPSREDRNAAYLTRLASDDFPWSNDMAHHLRRTFRIRSFRDHQKEIINCTMSGDDAFVIMRTGGGKSLTYQLPALLEGRGREKKVTLVVSPLISLIHDQEEQMNEFVPGSAVSFTSGMGSSEHARRWAQVRDPNGGVCLILVTPEKVHKSNKLRSELEKLNNNGRLGRFVIDEAHCACQWGHDFRPDYTKLGLLKTHFPTVPIIAVTATASDRVREDCTRILRLGTNYQLFRSSANRPNLRYSVRHKADGAQKVVDDMITFIRTEHPNDAGIIYTFSRKEADEVADKLCSGGIVARSYHSAVERGDKDLVHRSWMRNETQVVVATIAFGLGINKPDVRFVLHHSISKSLEGYYQESGRAGRDGLAADCILYYSTRDVSRTLGMIHGQHGEGGFWHMVRYAQSSGDDALCRAFILYMLGEPGAEDLQAVLRRGCSATEFREVGMHAKVAATLLWEARQNGDDLTPPQLVTLWRSKNPPACVKAHPPGNDLTKDECDRLIVHMILERVFEPRVVFNSYGSNVYVTLSQSGERLLRSSDPTVRFHFPKRKKKAAPKKARASAAAQPEESGWISAKKKKTPAGPKKGSRSKASASAPASLTGKAKKTGRSSSSRGSPESIIILSSSDEDSNDENNTRNNKKRRSGSAKQVANKKSKSPFGGLDSSDSDFTFD